MSHLQESRHFNRLARYNLDTVILVRELIAAEAKMARTRPIPNPQTAPTQEAVVGGILFYRVDRIVYQARGEAEKSASLKPCTQKQMVSLIDDAGQGFFGHTPRTAYL